MSESLLSFLDEGNREEIRKEAVKRWESLAEELLKDSDEEPQFPRIVKVPPHIFNQLEENE
jgi:hypothetical protein